jgi:hypothetical protein
MVPDPNHIITSGFRTEHNLIETRCDQNNPEGKGSSGSACSATADRKTDNVAHYPETPQSEMHTSEQTIVYSFKHWVSKKSFEARFPASATLSDAMARIRATITVPPTSELILLTNSQPASSNSTFDPNELLIDLFPPGQSVKQFFYRILAKKVIPMAFNDAPSDGASRATPGPQAWPQPGLFRPDGATSAIPQSPAVGEPSSEPPTNHPRPPGVRTTAATPAQAPPPPWSRPPPPRPVVPVQTSSPSNVTPAPAPPSSGPPGAWNHAPPPVIPVQTTSPSNVTPAPPSPS